MATTTATSAAPSFLGTRRGKLTLALLCAVAFVDLLDASIVNVALPQIQAHLHPSVQNLQWVASAYTSLADAPTAPTERDLSPRQCHER